MAKNRTYANGEQLNCSVISGTVSGSPVMIGQRPGVALTDRDADGYSVVAFEGVFELTVTAKVGAGNSAVVAGDILYYDAAETPDEVNKDVTNGIRFGYAHGPSGNLIAAGAAGTIQVVIGY